MAAKFNLKVFKKGSPILWIGGAIVVFVLFYMMFNRGGDDTASTGGGNVVVANQGPSENMQIAAMQAAAASRANDNALAVEMAKITSDGKVAEIGANLAAAELAASQTVAMATLQTDRDLTLAGFQTNIRAAEIQGEYSTESARMAYDSQIALREKDVEMLANQMAFNRDMMAIQSQNLIQQNLISQVGSLKKKDRDETLQIIGQTMLTGQAPSYTNFDGPAKIHGWQ